MYAAFTVSWALGSKKINPASYAWFHHSELFSFPWLTRLGYSVQMKTKYFMDNNLQVIVIPRINILSHENWGEKQVTDAHQKTANTTCTSWLPASFANDYAPLPLQESAAFLLVYLCSLLDAVIVVEGEEEFVNTDFDLSEVFPRTWFHRKIEVKWVSISFPLG